MAVVAAFFGPVSGRIVGGRGARVPLVLGGVGITLSALMLTGLTATTSVGWLMAAYVVFGIGFGFVNAPITNAAVSGMPAEQAGVAAAIASTSRQVGNSMGVAVIGATTTAAVAGSLHDGLAAASHTGWWIIVGCGVTVLVLGLASTTRWAYGTAARTAAGLIDRPLRRVAA
jgi:MFS family permease